MQICRQLKSQVYRSAPLDDIFFGVTASNEFGCRSDIPQVNARFKHHKRYYATRSALSLIVTLILLLWVSVCDQHAAGLNQTHTN